MLFARSEDRAPTSDFYGGIDIAAEPQHLFEIGRQGVCGVLAGQRGLIAQYAADHPEINYLVKMNQDQHRGRQPGRPLFAAVAYDLDAVLAMRGRNIVGIGYTIYLGSEYESTTMAEAGSPSPRPRQRPAGRGSTPRQGRQGREGSGAHRGRGGRPCASAPTS